MLADNVIILKNNYPQLYNEIKDKEVCVTLNIEIEDTKKSQKTIKLQKNGQRIYLHSKYDPMREAEAIIDKLEQKETIDKNIHVVFYGISLGYHIDVFTKRYPDISYSLYEPSLEIFNQFLNYKNLKDYSLKSLEFLQCEYSQSSLDEFLNLVTKRTDKKIVIAHLPIYQNIFATEYKVFLDTFKNIVKNKRGSLHTNYAFQKRWIINSIMNFKKVLSTSNIIIEKKGQFKGKTAILVAAGPSLNDEIDNLRYIKDNGLAYIFSVGSAINTLIHNNIYPDAACTYDPTVRNQMVFEMVKELAIKDIPMIFGSSVGYETLEKYPGEKYHMITSQDIVASYFLKNESEEKISIVQDAPSIAVVTLQLLHTLGFSNIILVGQNLGYRGKERYSEGISYISELTDEEIEKSIWVKDVYGNEILTNEGFNSMKEQMELYIKLLPNIKVINTTKGGAKIEGAKFRNLRDIIDTELSENIVDKHWLYGEKTNYDKEYLMSQTKKMDKSYKEALNVNKEYKLILEKIEKNINNKNYNQAEKLYIKLDKELRKIEHNDFYKTFILPMNRVQYKILADSIDSLNEESNLTKKGKRIVDSFRGFMDTCIRDIEMITPVYGEMKEEISSYIKP